MSSPHRLSDDAGMFAPLIVADRRLMFPLLHMPLRVGGRAYLAFRMADRLNHAP
jgi:hypothetical protein